MTLRGEEEPKWSVITISPMLGGPQRHSWLATGLTVGVFALNLEPYIAEAMESVIRFDADSCLKMVVIDDGSTNGTGAAIRNVVSANPYRSGYCVTRTNGGASRARNEGMKFVDTSHVYFLDGDDFVQNSLARKIVPRIDPHVDIFEPNTKIIADDSRLLGAIDIVNRDGERVVPRDRRRRQSMVDDFYYYVWLRVFRCQLVWEHPFPDGQRYEDVATVPQIYAIAQNVGGCPDCLVATDFGQTASCTLRTSRTVTIGVVCEGGLVSMHHTGDHHVLADRCETLFREVLHDDSRHPSV